jgi:hypothetical protein
MNPEQDGKVYGEWGNTALEAAAMGKIVITNTRSRSVYIHEYGDLGPWIANTPEVLEYKLDLLVDFPFEKINEEKRWMREWAHSKHGMQATGNRLREKVYNKLLDEVVNA